MFDENAQYCIKCLDLFSKTFIRLMLYIEGSLAAMYP